MKLEPDDYSPEVTTVWSFPTRGKWATHTSKYRGNFAPQVARNIIEMYSEPGEVVLDPMCGSGTTLIEARLLHRNAIGFDINPTAVELTAVNINFDYDTPSMQVITLGNAKDLSEVASNSIDLTLTHPPYLNIVKYSEGTIADDLSNIANVDKFCDQIEVVARELFRVMKPNKYCAVLMGDTRKKQHYVTLAYFVMDRFIKAGFVLKEDIIKLQHNCMATRSWSPMAKKFGFYMIMHEHLLVFRKPDIDGCSEIK